MDEIVVPSTSSGLKVSSSQSFEHNSESDETLMQLTESLRQGCVCHAKQPTVDSSANLSTQKFCALLHYILERFDNPEPRENDVDKLLIYMTFLRTVSKSSMHPTCYSDNGERQELYCKSLWEWQVVLQRVKFKMLSSILNVWRYFGNDRESHIRLEAEMAFGYLLYMVPCPVTRLEDCRRSCHKIMQSFIQIKYGHALSITPSFIIRLLKIMFCDVEYEPDLKRHRQLIENNLKNCKTAKVFIQRDGYSHIQSLRQSVLNELRQHWRCTWVKRFIGVNTEVNYEDELYFYDIWKALVAVNSTLPFSAMRDFVSPALLMVDNLPNETELTIKWKQLDVLNEILCYGSTLAIQSDIPVEASEIAQRLLRRAQSESFFEQFHVPSSPLGIAGNAKIQSHIDEGCISMPVLQKIVMLYLKAVAVVVREAQAISSSDESDSSLSSRGSSSIAEEEREMRLIGGNVLHLLNRLRIWTNEKTCRHHTSDLISTTCELFNDQDDSLIESLLCLLDIHTSLNTNYNMRPSTYIQDSLSSISNLTASITPALVTEYDSETYALPSQDMGHLLDIFNPVDGFDCLIRTISNDHSVILDFLLSNETCFLLYFLRILKYFNKNPISLCSHPSSNSRKEVLRKTWSSIKKLTNKSLFPYDISPVLKLLDKVVVLFDGPEKSEIESDIVLS